MSKYFDKNKWIKEYFMIIAGVSIMAFGVNAFLSPVDLVTGGFTGISIILRSVIHDSFGMEIPLWLSNTVLNVPLFLVGLRIFGVKKLSKTLFATFYLSFAFYYTEFSSSLFPVSEDLFLASVFGGVICGVGYGLVFRCLATTGGTDMLGMIANHFIKRFSIAKLMMVFDVAICTFGMFVFGPVKSLYAVISIYLSVKVCDSILEGMNFAKAVFIISEKSDEIADSLMTCLNRGASGIFARGMYTKKEKNILLSVVSKKEILHVKEIVSNIDRSAFVIVADVREVLGEGFQPMEL